MKRYRRRAETRAALRSVFSETRGPKSQLTQLALMAQAFGADSDWASFERQAWLLDVDLFAGSALASFLRRAYQAGELREDVDVTGSSYLRGLATGKAWRRVREEQSVATGMAVAA